MRWHKKIERQATVFWGFDKQSLVERLILYKQTQEGV